MEPLGLRRSLFSEEGFQSVPVEKKSNTQQLKLMEHVDINDLLQVSG